MLSPFSRNVLFRLNFLSTLNSQAGFCDLDHFCSCLIWFMVFALWRFVLDSGSRMMTQWIWFIIDWFLLVCVFLPDPLRILAEIKWFYIGSSSLLTIVFIDPLSVSLSKKGLFMISALKNNNDSNWLLISKLNIWSLSLG